MNWMNGENNMMKKRINVLLIIIIWKEKKRKDVPHIISNKWGIFTPKEREEKKKGKRREWEREKEKWRKFITFYNKEFVVFDKTGEREIVLFFALENKK